jgi:4-aminobutyrate aminotransferase-like enzyme
MCAVLGHNHPAITAAVEEAGASVTHLFSGMLSPDVIRFASELAELLPADLQKVLLVTTGSESNEAAIRMAKMHTGGHEVLGLSGSWHGMTAASTRHSLATTSSTAVTDHCLDLGLNLNIVKFPGMGAVLRIAPPMTVTDDEIDRALEIMDTALSTAGA